MTDLEREVEEDVVLAVLFLVLEEVLMEGAVRVHPEITHTVLILGSREGTHIIYTQKATLLSWQRHCKEFSLYFCFIYFV